MKPRSNHTPYRARLTKAQAIAEFYDVLLPDSDPASMGIAQDLCETYGLKLADLGEQMARNGFENKHWTETQGWADFDVSAGEFVVSETRSPFFVDMRPPTRGERGWWVKARTPAEALAEMLLEGANTEGSLGWLAPEDIDGDPDEHDMIAVTVVRDPAFMATWWSIYHRPLKGKLRPAGPGGGYRIGLGAWYGGRQWDEGKSGVTGVQVTQVELESPGYAGMYDSMSDPYFIDKNNRALPKDAKQLAPIVLRETFRTLQDARRAATELAWAMAKVLKEGRAHGQNSMEVAVYLRELVGAKGYKPPRAIVNPGRGAEAAKSLFSGLAELATELNPRATARKGGAHRVVRAQRVVAKFERSEMPEFPNGKVIGSPQDVVDAMSVFLGDHVHESFVVIFINIRNGLLGFAQMTEAGLAGVTVDASGIFREALAAGAAGMVTVHNHPSGDPTPSNEDRALWARLREIGKLIGIPVVDNMVIGKNRHFSESEAAQ